MKVYRKILETPIGKMLAVADEQTLLLLEFVERQALEERVEKFCASMQADIVSGNTPIFNIIKEELTLYFKGELLNFKTPFRMFGTPFQKDVWNELLKIPFGETRSYAEIARALGKPTAYRAVAQSNGANRLAIVIPCHRVINTNGGLGGYAGTLPKKIGLLSHEWLFSV